MQPSAYRRSRTSDQFGRYYTDEAIGHLLVSRLGANAPQLILDLGAGEGTLADAARKRWKMAHIVTVDGDSGIPSRLALMIGGQHRHFDVDALEPALPHVIGIELGSVDAAVCNPPYIRPRWRQGYSDLLESAGLSAAFPAIQEAGAEVLFLAQNLRLMRPGAPLGLIVPDGFIAGQRHRALRQLLLARHSVECVIQLPRNAFRQADAQTHIVILRKGPAETSSVRIHELTSLGLSTPIELPQKAAVERLDYSYYRYRNVTLPSQGVRRSISTLANLSIEISRGRITSKEAREMPYFVFHTTDFPSDSVLYLAPRKTRLTRSQANNLDTVIAEPGDILMARIGRNLGSKICMLQAGRVPISDCVYRIRVAEPWRNRLLARLTSPRGRQWLTGAACGVGARQLSKFELLQFPLELEI